MVLAVGLVACSGEAPSGAPSEQGAGQGAGGAAAPPPMVALPVLPQAPEFEAPPPTSNLRCNTTLPVTYRDFHESHPDFEMPYSGDVVRRQLVASALGLDRKPVYQGSIGCPGDTSTPLGCFDWQPDRPVITSQATFRDWYRDVPGRNVRVEGELELQESAPGSGGYVFRSNEFFPLSEQEGFGITPAGSQRNFLFTTELHLVFTYAQGQRFQFLGDDDLWIFVNDRLALDLGSMHGEASGVIDFDAQAAALGIEPGARYSMDIFHAERHTSESRFAFETNITCFEGPTLR